MLALGIETSGRPGSVALCRDSDCLASLPLDHGDLRHAQALPPLVASLLADNALSTDDLDLIAVSRGPGSFTGLRVGFAFAKTLAWATGCHLFAIDTFQAIASAVEAKADSVWVAADAQRHELFVRPYAKRSDQRWEATQDHRIVPAAQWCFERTPEEIVVTASPGLLDDHLAETIVCEPAAQSIAQLGQLATHTAQVVTPAELGPLYLRQSAAQEKRQARIDSLGQQE
jgi:tRNA threonylcarbamoyladenosine biosynthesis protein TsaB